MVARDLKVEQANAPTRKTVVIEVPAPAQAANDNRPATAIDAQSLLSMEFPPVVYVVPGVIAEGLTILGGRPKLGKSWLALSAAIAVASGGTVLGEQCEQGDALYLALEDNQRRLQDRLKTLLPALKSMRPDLSRLQLDTEAPKIDGGLIERLDAWRIAAVNPRMVIIDTLAMVRPLKKRTQDAYEADYAALSPLQRYASEHRLAVVVVTHVRKMEAADPLEMISGTNGLTGAADSILVLNRDTDGPKLYGRGRDIKELEKAMRFENGRWSVLGDAVEMKLSAERREVIAALEDAVGPMSPAEIAKVIGKPKGNLNVLLTKMVRDGEAVKVSYGLYAHPGKTGQSGKSSEESNQSNHSKVVTQGEAAA
ncbi:MAG: AAA family ATPase [Rhizobiaceae bacterium]|nr:AAA family ATPase [Rhizobiaceae bacterium]